MKPIGYQLIDECMKRHMADDETVLLADGLEPAFMAIGRQLTHPVAIYSKRRTIKLLQRQGMTKEEAEQYFDFNIAGAFIGDQTPVFLQDE